MLFQVIEGLALGPIIGVVLQIAEPIILNHSLLAYGCE